MSIRELKQSGNFTFYFAASIVMVKISRKLRWTRHMALMWEARNTHGILVGKPVGKQPVGML
jgi:hypothetical protein